MVVRKSAPASSAARWLEVSILWLHVKLGGRSQAISESLWPRLRRQLDHVVRSMSQVSYNDLELDPTLASAGGPALPTRLVPIGILPAARWSSERPWNSTPAMLPCISGLPR